MFFTGSYSFIWAISSSEGSGQRLPAWLHQIREGLSGFSQDWWLLEPRDLHVCRQLVLSLLVLLSEDVDVCDAEHGVSPVLLCRSWVPVICEWRPEAAAEAAAKLWWPRCPIQREDASCCPASLFLYVTVYQVLWRGEWKVETAFLCEWLRRGLLRNSCHEFSQNIEKVHLYLLLEGKRK